MNFFLFSTLIISITSTTKSAHEKTYRDVSSNAVGCLKCHPTDEGKINVHLVPHSHDDVGWLKTVDQYFYGGRPNIDKASVQNIITSVVEALLENSNRRFVQVETAFLWKWWKSQSDDMRNKFKYLVDNGQIEMVNGAWSMNDEACSNYQSTIDQFTWGLRFINDTIGACGIPRIGWQIDPFGHSREQASIFAQLGYDGVFISRLDHADRKKRNSENTLSFAWQGSANLDHSIIFGGIFPTDGYAAPNGFCWDYRCNDEPVDDDPESSSYNIDKLVENFVTVITEYAKYYPSKHILIPMGEDFFYEVAEKNFINMDKLIKAIRDNPEVNVLYSTPSCYIKAVSDAQPQLELKINDFFPYSDKTHSFWTGYYTSRPNSKRFERTGHNVLHATKQLVALNSSLSGSNYESTVKSLEDLNGIMGVMQHHDAITGTERQHVANDYVRLLTRAIEEAEDSIGSVIGDLLRINSNEMFNLNLNISSCLLTNVSICSISQTSQRFLVVAYNPLAWTVTQYVRLPVENASYTVEGPDGQVENDIVSTIHYFQTDIRNKSSDSEILFAAKNIPPMGIKMYYVTKTSNNPKRDTSVNDDETFYFGDENTGFQIDNETNLLKSITMNGISVDITQNFYYYKSEIGEFDKSYISSGAYVFRPTKSSPDPLRGEVIATGIIRTNNVEEFHQRWSDDKISVAQIIRVYKDENYVEFDWLVGGIKITDDVGKEVITRYTVDEFENENVFYTDSNGREMIKRELNFRLDYTYNATADPVASNYYPVTSRIMIKDENRDVELAILTDRSQGGSSLHEGQIELMIHRRILHDDNKGVAENLNETEFGSGVYVRGSHYFVIGSATKTNPDGKTTAAQQRVLVQKKLLHPWIGIAKADSDTLTLGNVKSKLKLSYSGLSKDFPDNINILTYEPWKNSTYLIRFEHIMEKEDDSNLSKVTTLDVSNIFNSFKIKEMNETTLGANEWLQDYNLRSRYVWNTKNQKMHVISPVNDSSEWQISLTPMQIRTFIITVESSAFSHKASFTIVFLTVLSYRLQ